MRYSSSIKIIIFSLYVINLFSSNFHQHANKVIPIRSWSIEENMEFKVRAIIGGAYFRSYSQAEETEIKDLYLYAVEQNRLEIIEKLHDFGQRSPIFFIKDTHRYYDTHDTLLHVAARGGSKQAIKLLLGCGLSVHEKNANGQVARDVALDWGHKELERILDG